MPNKGKKEKVVCLKAFEMLYFITNCGSDAVIGIFFKPQ